MHLPEVRVWYNLPLSVYTLKLTLASLIIIIITKKRWGILQFESNPSATKMYYDEWTARCAAMAIYYAEKSYYAKEKKYTVDVEALKAYSAEPFPIFDEADISISITSNGYEARVTIDSYTATVNEERYLVVTAQERFTTTTSES